MSLLHNTQNAELPASEKGCMKNKPDCYYLGADGNCSAEWCIYDNLPKILKDTKLIKCAICNENTTRVSLYSNRTEFICSTCQPKLIRIIKNKSCPICGRGIQYYESICTTCASKIKENIYE